MVGVGLNEHWELSNTIFPQAFQVDVGPRDPMGCWRWRRKAPVPETQKQRVTRQAQEKSPLAVPDRDSHGGASSVLP